MSRLLSTLLVGALLLTGGAAHAAMVTSHYVGYSVTYDDSTLLGNIDFSFNGETTGFGWNLPSAIAVSRDEAFFRLPDFTVTAAPGYSLGNILGAFIGNLSFAESGSEAMSYALIRGDLSIDGGPNTVYTPELERTELLNRTGFRSGFYSLGGSMTLAGTINTFSVSDFLLYIAATRDAGVFSTDQPQLKFEFAAIPVPEPETYALLLAGLGLVGLAARRRLH